MSRIYTRETTFNKMSDKEREGLSEGFKLHLSSHIKLDDMTVNDIYNMLTTADPKVIFYREKGKDKFKMQLNERKFIANFLGDRMIINKN